MPVGDGEGERGSDEPRGAIVFPAPDVWLVFGRFLVIVCGVHTKISCAKERGERQRWKRMFVALDFSSRRRKAIDIL